MRIVDQFYKCMRVCHFCYCHRRLQCQSTQVHTMFAMALSARHSYPCAFAHSAWWKFAIIFISLSLPCVVHSPGKRIESGGDAIPKKTNTNIASFLFFYMSFNHLAIVQTAAEAAAAAAKCEKLQRRHLWKHTEPTNFTFSLNNAISIHNRVLG